MSEQAKLSEVRRWIVREGRGGRLIAEGPRVPRDLESGERETVTVAVGDLAAMYRCPHCGQLSPVMVACGGSFLDKDHPSSVLMVPVETENSEREAEGGGSR